MFIVDVVEKFLVGMVDIVLFVLFIGVLLYWFCGCKKKVEIVVFI